MHSADLVSNYTDEGNQIPLLSQYLKAHYCASGIWYEDKISKILKQNVIYSVRKLSVFKEVAVLYILQLCSFCNPKSYVHQCKPTLWYTC